MGCLHPICIRAPELKIGLRVRQVYTLVPCGKCPDCLKKRQQDWSIRIQKETDNCLKNGGSAYFITITYDDEHLNYGSDDRPTLYPPDVQVFLKRLRRQLEYKYEIKMRFFLCGEYGDSFDRPHYHFCFWSDRFISSEDLRPLVESSWPYGLTLGINPMNVQYSEYVAKYSCKRFGIDYTGVVPPFARMSLKPAVGYCFVDGNTEDGKENISFYRRNALFHTFDVSHVPFALPRYYRDRIHTLDTLNKRFLELQRKDQEMYDINTRFNPRYTFDLYKSYDEYEESFFKKLKYKSMGINVL